MSDLTIKKRINKNQVEKYKQYGRFNTGQTKESADTFENLMGALNKIKTDLVSLSIVLENADRFDDKNIGTTSEFREVLNHALDAKKQLKQSTFKTFLPNEIDQIKEMFSVMEEFIATLDTFVTPEKVENEIDKNRAFGKEQAQMNKDLKQAVSEDDELREFQKLVREYVAINPDNVAIPQIQQRIRDLQAIIRQRPEEKTIDYLKNELLGVEEQIEESDTRVVYLQRVTSGQQFPLYKSTIEELLILMKNKVLRNEGDISKYATTLGGCNTTYNWIHEDWIKCHQNQEFI